MASTHKLIPSKDQKVSRHGSAKIDPSQAAELRANHPALNGQGRTLFPTTVINPDKSPRLFVSGHNNPKLGAVMKKGWQKGWPIFHLTLEERATCPMSCPQWRACYGNSMHLARRHQAGPELERLIPIELDLLTRDYPNGYLIRLHTLGDFYSRPYVALWARMLKEHPALHVFGYTARTEMADDAESRAIAADIGRLTDKNWRRFAIRFSRAGGGPQGTMVVDEDPDRPDVRVCPAQTGGSIACATCGLCWVDAYRDKTIAFLRHGMRRAKVREAPREVMKAPEPLYSPAPPETPVEGPITPALRRLAESGDPIAKRALARKEAIFGKVES